MDTHVHDRRPFLPLTAGAAATPLLAACGAGFGGGSKKSDGSAADDVTGSFDWKREKGTTVKALLRLGEQQVSLVAPRADTTGLRPDDPVRLTVRPENLLLFAADRPQGPGRLIGTR